MLTQAKDKRPSPHEKTQEQQGGKIDLCTGADVTSGGKKGDKERKDEGQKTNPMEIKRDNEEKRQKAQTSDIFNQLNEVIVSKDLILQDVHSWLGSGKQHRNRNTGKERRDVCYL